MGFLNHATNNIIIDAVLTERGRELLSRNDGSFSIESFAFGDDEVDYSLIEKYGLDIGKEKIEKNTPIFEANPNENIAIKHPLITFSNPLLRINQIPSLKWSNTSSGETKIELFDTAQGTDITGTEKPLIIKNNVNTAGLENNRLDENITDNTFNVKMHGALLKIKDETPIDTDINGIDTYSLTKDTTTFESEWDNQTSVSFTVYSNGVVSSSDFENYSTVGDANKIVTSVQVLGLSSGAKLVIPVVIQKRPTS